MWDEPKTELKKRNSTFCINQTLWVSWEFCTFCSLFDESTLAKAWVSSTMRTLHLFCDTKWRIGYHRDCKHERHKGVTTENGWQAECSGGQLDTGPHLRRQLVTHRCNLRASICEIVVASYGGGVGLVELWSLQKVGHIGGGAGGSVWFSNWLFLPPISLIDARDLNIFLTHQLIFQFIVAPPTLC